MDLYTKCNHCGEMIKIGEINCINSHCTKSINSTVIDNFTPNIELNNKINNSTSTPKATPEQKFPVIFISSGKRQVGYILVFNDEIRFKPSKYNIGVPSEEIIPITNICGYDLDTVLNVTIYTTDERKVSLISWNTENILTALEGKRQAYFESQGNILPELTKGKYNKNLYNSNVDLETNIKDIKRGIVIGIIMILLGLVFAVIMSYCDLPWTTRRLRKYSPILIVLGIFVIIKNIRKSIL